MAIDYGAIARAGGISKGTPSVLLKGRKKKARHDQEQAWKDAIDKRDGMVSRISGKPLSATTTNPEHLRDHCHIKAKGAHPELRYEVGNGFNASRYEHRLLHAGALELEGTDANGRLIFRWANHIKPEDRTFRILSKRRSQNRTAV